MDGLGTIPFERLRRLEFVKSPDGRFTAMLESHLQRMEPAVRAQAERGRVFAESLDYSHPGLSKEVYLAHPYRVASLYCDLARPFEIQGFVLGLVHNVLEVSDAEPERLVQALGLEIASAVRLLTLDRARQWDKAYKVAYYQAISAAATYIGAIKVLDKLDNLFMICRNPAQKVRERYLAEIETWVIPLARKSISSELADYMSQLVVDNSRIGYTLNG